MTNHRWYCQPDGGQWNVRVTIIDKLLINGVVMLVICGDKLQSMYDANGYGVMVVPPSVLYEVAQ